MKRRCRYKPHLDRAEEEQIEGSEDYYGVSAMTEGRKGASGSDCARSYG